jgi:hypothetical protein
MLAFRRWNLPAFGWWGGISIETLSGPSYTPPAPRDGCCTGVAVRPQDQPTTSSTGSLDCAVGFPPTRWLSRDAAHTHRRFTVRTQSERKLLRNPVRRREFRMGSVHFLSE